MSDFGEVMDAILVDVQAAIADTVDTQRGFSTPDSVYLEGDGVFVMVYNPEEVSERLDDAQADRSTQYLLALFRPAGEFDQVATDLDAIRDRLSVEWSPGAGPLGGLVDQLLVVNRTIDERMDPAKTIGIMAIQTWELL